MKTNKNREKTPAWLPTCLELTEYALEVESPLWDTGEDGEAAKPSSAGRGRELRWFIDEHIEWAGWSFEALAAYALEHGSFDAARYSVARAADALARVAERMGREVNAA
jgi:hypothetical protein